MNLPDKIDKFKGQRFGQLISNAMYHKYRWRSGVNTAEFYEYLFYMDDKEFTKMLNDYLISLPEYIQESEQK